MDFHWSSSDCELYERATAFARNLQSRLGRPVHGDDDASSWRENWRRCGDFGLLGLSVPAELGGTGCGALTTARVLEAFGKSCRDGGILFSSSAHLFACAMPIAEYGDIELKRGLVPRLASGELVGANAITEAEAGSDVAAAKTTATRDGDHYTLNGTKSYVTNGPEADVFLVYAATHANRGFFGLTAFVLDKKTPGLVVGRPFPKIGLHSAPTCEIYLENCRVPALRRLGEEGQGISIFQSSMAWERGCLFAAYLGAMERDLDVAIAFARERRQFGRPIGKNQAISHRIADMKLRLESARLLLYRACWLKDQGSESTLDISLAKLAVSEAAVQSGLDLIRIHGSVGISGESGIAESLLNALPSTIFSGTSEIQRDLISRSLGL
jgi:alkylation response protein AidB-like acyl-CoA dehydrogenase